MNRAVSRLRSEWMRVACISTFASAFLLALTLAVVPQLHERIHTDANASAHECAVTLINHGKYQPATTPLMVAPEPVVFVAFAPAPVMAALPSIFLSASLLEHAPPRLA